MGELGLSLREAQRFPHTMFWPVFHANERRRSRTSIHVMEDLIAVGGLQGEMKEPGARKTSKGKTIPVGYLKHLEKRTKEGWPSKRVWTERLERQAQEKFWADLGELPMLDLTGNGEVSDG